MPNWEINKEDSPSVNAGKQSFGTAILWLSYSRWIDQRVVAQFEIRHNLRHSEAPRFHQRGEESPRPLASVP